MAHVRRNVLRFDKSSVSPSGQLIVDAKPTRVGVFVYVVDTDAGPLEIRELRPPEEVFAEESLASMRGVTLVKGHPAFINADNWKYFAVGHAADDVREDGDFVAVTLRVNQGDAIGSVVTKADCELSCAYTADLEPTPGEYNGEPYDVIQRNIRYNHIGMGPIDWGRGGNDVRIYLDSLEFNGSQSGGTSDYNQERIHMLKNALTQFRLDNAVQRVALTPSNPGAMPVNATPTPVNAPLAVRADGTPELTLSVDVVGVVRDRDAALRRIAELEAEAEVLRAAQAANVQSEQAAMTDAAIAERVELLRIADARGVKVKVSDSPRAIREAVIAHVRPGMAFAKADSDDTVRGAFLLAVSAPVTTKRGTTDAADALGAELDRIAEREDAGEEEASFVVSRARQDGRASTGRRGFGEAPIKPSTSAGKGK